MEVKKLEIVEGDFLFVFSAIPEKFKRAKRPHLIETISKSQPIPNPGEVVPKEIIRRVFALAAIIFNKFKA